eukprot:9489198-Pyramimonas_sp.AAC.1
MSAPARSCAASGYLLRSTPAAQAIQLCRQLSPARASEHKSLVTNLGSGAAGAVWARRAFMWNGHGVDAKGHGVDAKGHGVDAKGHGDVTKGYDVDAKGQLGECRFPPLFWDGNIPC